MVTADQVAATLKFLAPGFVFLKVFELRGLAWRRTDLEWTVWALIASAGIATALSPLALKDENAQLVASMASALVAGLLAGWAWRSWSSKNEAAGASFQPRAWDTILTGPMWVQVRLIDGTGIRGAVAAVAESRLTDDLDMYLVRCEWVASDGTRTPMEKVEGVLINRSQIALLQVLA